MAWLTCMLLALLCSVCNVTSHQDCSEFRADVAFLLDASLFTSSEDWSKVLSFLVNVTRQLDIDGDWQRVSVLTYTQDATVHFTLDEHVSEDTVVSAILDLPQPVGPGKDTGNALSVMNEQIFQSENGDRPAYPNIAVIITNGHNDSDLALTLTQAAAARERQAVLFVVAIGSDAQLDDLAQVAHQPASHYVFHIEEVTDIGNITDALLSEICLPHEMAVQGMVGAPGLQGQPGPVGPASNRTGSAGTRGLPGFTGATGEPGRKGDRGLRGRLGETGVIQGGTGHTGLEGRTGDTGLKGPKGVKGDMGDHGPEPTGSPGDIGATGVTGLRGLPGVQGPRGAVGATGAPGVPSIVVGETGYTGSTGATGPRGPRGEQPTAPGEPGALGPVGPPGPVGFIYEDGDGCLTEPCHHICINLRVGHRCDCHPGYHLSEDAVTCLDTDECEVQNGGCEHYCHNHPGSHSCSCAEGLTLSRDDRTCIDVDECCGESLRQHTCPPDHTCLNTHGSYFCVHTWRIAKPDVDSKPKRAAQTSPTESRLLSNEFFVAMLVWLGGLSLLMLLTMLLMWLDNDSIITHLRKHYEGQQLLSSRTSYYSPSAAEAEVDIPGMDNFIFPRFNITTPRRKPRRYSAMSAERSVTPRSAISSTPKAGNGHTQEEQIGAKNEASQA